VLAQDQPRVEGGNPSTRTGLSRLRISRTYVVVGALVVIAIAALATSSGAIQAVLLGLGSGALIAAIALGVVVTYRGSGVVNFAVGALAMYASYAFYALDAHGNLLLIAWQLHIGPPMSLLPALIVTTALTALGSLGIYWAVFYPLRNASAVAQIIASVGVLLVVQAVIILTFGASAENINATVVSGSVNLSHGIVVPASELVLGGIVVLMGLAISLIYTRTGFGRLSRASAESERNLILQGRSPAAIGSGNWMLSGAVIAVLGVLSAVVNGVIDPTTTTLLVVPALAAAVVGGFSSFGAAVGVGLTIGMLQGLIGFLSGKAWFPTSGNLPVAGIAEAVPFVIILLSLLARRGVVSGRGSLGEVWLPFAPKSRVSLAKVGAAGVVAGVLLLFVGPVWRTAGSNSLVGVAICLSIVIATGFVGQVSLAQLAIAGVSAFLLAKLGTAAHIPFPFAPILACLAATAIGVLVAVPALRLRGVQLAIATAAGAVWLGAVFGGNAYFSGGFNGTQVGSLNLFSVNFGPNQHAAIANGSLPNPWFGLFALIVVLVLVLVTARLRGSSLGRRMLAIRANERAAAAVGIDVVRTKILTFGISALVAGIAGALSAYRFGSVTGDYYAILPSLTFLAFAYMGGISSISGAVIGGLLVTDGVIFTALQQWTGLSPNYTQLIGGLGLVVTVLTNPEGIAGGLRATFARLSPTLGRLARAGRPLRATDS
jgi:branched-chain amino acid transport system permease protein